ncbi:MAG: hypothetical protein SNJ49_13080 [Chloracidobacterium sp.]
MASSIACGSKAQELVLTVDGKSQPVALKSGYIYPSTIGLSKNTETKKASSYAFHLADYNLNPERGQLSLREAPTSDGYLVVFELIGKENEPAGTPLAPGVYPMATAGAGPFQFSVTRDYGLGFHSYQQSKKTLTSLDSGKMTGSVKISAVAGEDVSGEIDVTDGKKSIKGSFTAKMIKLPR